LLKLAIPLTVSPLLTVAPAFRNAPPDAVNRPVPDCVKLPLSVMVEAARVEGIPLGGGYTAPFTEDTKRLAVLTVKELRAFVMIGAEPMFVRPPLKVIVDAFRVEGIPPLPPGGYGALLMVFTFMLLVLMLMVLISLARSPPLKVARPFAENVFVAMVGPLN